MTRVTVDRADLAWRAFVMAWAFAVYAGRTWGGFWAAVVWAAVGLLDLARPAARRS